MGLGILALATALAPPAFAQSFDETARTVFEGASRVTATDERLCTLDVTDLNGASPATIFVRHIDPAETRLSSVSLDGAIFSDFLFTGSAPVLCFQGGQCFNQVESRIVADEYDRRRLVGTLVHLFTDLCPAAAGKGGG